MLSTGLPPTELLCVPLPELVWSPPPTLQNPSHRQARATLKPWSVSPILPQPSVGWKAPLEPISSPLGDRTGDSKWSFNPDPQNTRGCCF